MVYVTHDQEEALAVSDEIVVMRNASIAQMGTPRQLYDTPADTFVADFIGEANLLPCEVTAVNGEVANVSLGDFHTTLPSRGVGQGAAIIAIRPSRLVIGAAEGFNAVVSKATYVGSRMEYTLVSGFSTMFAVRDDVDNPLSIGQEIVVGFSQTGPVLLPVC